MPNGRFDGKVATDSTYMHTGITSQATKCASTSQLQNLYGSRNTNKITPEENPCVNCVTLYF